MKGIRIFRRGVRWVVVPSIALLLPFLSATTAQAATCTAPFGTTGNDTLTATANDQVICGLGGDDTIEPGTFNVTVDGGAGTDTVSYSSLPGGTGVTVDLSNTGTQTTIGAGTITLSAVENVTGSANADTLTGDGGRNVLDGLAGGDSLDGQGGDDTLVPGAGNDTVVGGDGGADWLMYTNAPAGVTADLASGSPQVTADGFGGADTISSVENVTGSGFGDNLSGDANRNLFIGLAGVDTFTGRGGNDGFMTGAGNDTVNGDAGSDQVSYWDAPAGVTVNLTAGSATADGFGGVDTINSAEEALGSPYNDALTGSTGPNLLFGRDGNDTLVGRLGTDTLAGGLGTDIVDYSGESVAVSANLSAGTATYTGGSDSLATAENVVASPSGGTLTGDANANVLTGSAVAETIIGGDGNDTITGGGGTDTLEGGNGNDTITGGTGNDTLMPGAGTNIVHGGGNSALSGPTGGASPAPISGGDWLDYSDLTAGVTVTIGSGGSNGSTTGGATDTSDGIEHVTGSQYVDTLNGSSGENNLYGTGGVDDLVGNSGNDYLNGGDPTSGAAWPSDDRLAGNGGSNDVCVSGGTNDLGTCETIVATGP